MYLHEKGLAKPSSVPCYSIPCTYNIIYIPPNLTPFPPLHTPTSQPHPTPSSTYTYLSTSPHSLLYIHLHPNFILFPPLLFTNLQDSSEHEVYIVVTDKGDPTLSASVLVTVQVDDVNEFSPVFQFSEEDFPDGEYRVETLSTAREGKNSKIIT